MLRVGDKLEYIKLEINQHPADCVIDQTKSRRCNFHYWLFFSTQKCVVLEIPESVNETSDSQWDIVRCWLFVGFRLGQSISPERLESIRSE